MRILLTRTRIGERTPIYAYRVHVPFTDISCERQALIASHCDYGLVGWTCNGFVPVT